MVPVSTEPVTVGRECSISDVVVAVLGEDESVSALDPSHAVLVAARLVIDEAMGVHAHWDTTTPAGAMAVVKGHLRRRYADLTEEALHALAAYSTRDFRRSGV